MGSKMNVLYYVSDIIVPMAFRSLATRHSGEERARGITRQKESKQATLPQFWTSID